MASNISLIPSIIRDQVFDTESNSIKTILTILLFIGTVALLHGTIKENIVNTSSIVIIIIMFFITYIFFKKKYNDKIKLLKKKNKILAEPSVLDEICTGNMNNNICRKYYNSKKDFYKISNLLLQQYNFN